MLTNNLFDEYPHWIVGDKHYYNVLTAWQAIRDTKQDFRYYFYEKQYDQHDWTVEPSESWEELCRARALQLRQKYKKLSLFYSAGRDSDHILNVFESNSIPIDELVLMSFPFWPLREFELNTYILPRAKEFVARHPETKITVMKYDKTLYDNYYTKNWAEKHGLRAVRFFPSNSSFTAQHNVEYKESYGFILGVDKPRITIEDGKFCSVVLDKSMEHHSSETDNVELFYYAPSMPTLHIKQSWMLLNHLERTFAPEQLTNEVIAKFCGDAHSVYYNDFCLACGRGPGWNASLGIQNGSTKAMRGGYDPVFVELAEKTKQYGWQSTNHYLNFIKDLSNDMSFAFNKGDVNLGTIGIYSKKYVLKNVKKHNS